MAESVVVVQFAELVRQALVKRATASSKEDVVVWLGELEDVRTGTLPAALMDDVCPACHVNRPHLLRFLGNFNQFTCLGCGYQHSEQLARQK